MEDETQGAADVTQSRLASAPAGLSTSSGRGGTGGRFAAGTILLDRYRIVGLLGRGGMGEVYKAEDLRLDQPVALKFLPESVGSDPVRLSQFHNEVRTARQVTHKNVCRMYDIGEVDGRPFLSMEYVDGEDLASLLRRIGRLPQDKAVEIARQLCAGLAAAHERGVLHRDLKPANVMLDGEGHVRLTDFGLAGAAGQGELRAGTPAYMAPEQLAGRDVSVQSDLFALGLVLYEVFTGRRAVDVKSVDELVRLHEAGLTLTATDVVQDLDPAVDRVIRRCLQRDPRDRPSSALGVSAALPGGDPLAAALAAGETPSPEMVAAAGHTTAVPAPVAVGLLVAFLVGLAGLAGMAERVAIVRRVAFERPPEVLLDRARDLARRLGYPPPADHVWGFDYDKDFLAYASRTRQDASRWDSLASQRTPAVTFFYRSSPRSLVALSFGQNPTLTDPPLTMPGMVSVVQDPSGHLLEFHAVPPEHDDAQVAGAEPPWQLLLEAAGLDERRLTSATPE